MVGAIGRLKDRQGALEGGAGGGQLAQLPLDDAQVGEGDGDRGVVGTVGRLVDGQGALEGGAGGGQLAQLPLDDAQAAEGDGDLGVVGTVDAGEQCCERI